MKEFRSKYEIMFLNILPLGKERYQNLFFQALTFIQRTFLLVTLGFIGTKAFFQFDTAFDYWAYQLPMALRFFSLTTFSPHDLLEVRYSSFPPLANVLQGFLVYLTGRISASCALNFVGLGIAVLALKSLGKEKFSVTWFLTSVLAVPLICLHLYSGYIDLWSALFVAVALAALDTMNKANYGKTASIAIGAVMIAMLSKYTVWAPCSVLVAAFIVKTWNCCDKRRALLWSFLMVYAFMIWPVRNYLRYDNPVFPFPPPLQHLEKTFPEWNHGYGYQLGSPPLLQNWPRPLLFLLSTFEITRLFQTRNDRFGWSYDQGGDRPYCIHYRLGGWTPYFPLIGLIALFIIAASRTDIVQKKNTIPSGAFMRFFEMGKEHFVDIAFFICVVITMLYSGKHDLRYSLYIPLYLAYKIALLPQRRFLGLKMVLLGTVWWVLSTINPYQIDFRLPQEYAPTVAKEFWKQALPQTHDQPNLIDASAHEAIFFSGPSFNTYWVKNTGWGKNGVP